MPQPPFNRTIIEGSGDGAGLAVEGSNSRPFGLDFLQDVISVSWGSRGFLVFSGTVNGLASNDGENWVSVTYPIAATCGAFGDGRWIISDGRPSTGAVSKDTGKTWSPISLPDEFNFLAYIKPDKKAKKGIFGATNRGRSVYTSTDSGGAWQKFDLDSSSGLFLVGVGKVFIMDGGANGVVEPSFVDDIKIQLPFSFPVYSGSWGSGSAFDSVPWDQLTGDPSGEQCDIFSVTAAYDSETEQYKLWAIAEADGQAIMSATSGDGFSWSGSTFEYTPGFSADLELPLGFVSTGESAGGNGVLLVTTLKEIADDPSQGIQGGSMQTSGVFIDGNFDTTPGQSGHFTFGTGLTAGGAAFCKNANNGAGLFAVGFYTSDENNKLISAKISTSAEGGAWNSIDVSIAPISIVVGDVSGFLAIGEPIA